MLITALCTICVLYEYMNACINCYYRIYTGIAVVQVVRPFVYG